MKKPLKIVITSGDVDGIGPEIVTKALCRLGPQKNVQFILWRSKHFAVQDLRRLDRRFRRQSFPNWPAAQKASWDYYKDLIDIESYRPPARWVEEMGKAGAQGRIDGLVTAPLSKSGILKAGLKDIGHTEILARTSKTRDIFMTFLGRKFNVVLLTGHTNIKRAYDGITPDLLNTCLERVAEALPLLPPKLRKKPIGLVGLSPHAGEGGVIDNKEKEIYLPAIKRLRQKKVAISEPLVPDVCFQEKFWDKYSFYVASYHDQGLIPFKMVHSAMPGVQISLGLPFVRTSVDHGTAKDIFGKNRANEASMVRAIEVAIQLANAKTIKW